MHSNKFRDPLISRAQPVTIITPVVDETLRTAGVSVSRELILDRFMSGQPRIAVVHGGEDHPPNVGSRDTIRRAVRQIWANGAIPFDVAQSAPCEELSYGTEGMNYALMSRNFCTANLAALIEAHGYDAAIVLGVCDKMMAGSLRALIEADLARQRRKARPVFAALIPSFVARETFISDEDRRRFDVLRRRLSESELAELDALLHQPMKSQAYARMKGCLDRCFHRRLLQEDEKDELQRTAARCASTPGANCAASEASIIHRLVLASFGFVPRKLDISVRPPTDPQVSEIVKRLLQAIQKRERRVSAAGLTRHNLANAAAVWSATGRHPAWLLHLTYLADAVNKKLTIADMTRTAHAPQILALNDAGGNSVYSMALEAESGGNSGIDTIMRTLSEKRLIDDRAPTLDGPWAQRITEARSANGNFLYSTMTPVTSACSMVRLNGNMCSGAVARLGVGARNGSASAFDKKIYLAAYYLGPHELEQSLAATDGVLERLKAKTSREDLYDTWLYNWHRNANPQAPDLSSWNKARLWQWLVSERLLRVMIIVAGAGPRACGMPELQMALNAASQPLNAMCAFATDGRVSFQYDGLSIAYMVPEAFEGGVLAGIRTGDWIYLDLSRGELDVVQSSDRGFKVLSPKQIENRPEFKKRIHELQRRRMDLLPSFRVILDQVSSAETGVSPAAKR